MVSPGTTTANCIGTLSYPIHRGTDNDVISMPAGFRVILWVTLFFDKCFFHCDIAEIRFVGDHTDIFINQQISQRTECYLNNRINLRHLTPHISHKMAVVSWPQIL